MIAVYDERYKEEVIKLILYVQNVEAGVGISIEEQPDILDIQSNYINEGGNFWIALNDDKKVVGSIGLQKKTDDIAILKKFFVYKDYRGKELGTGKKLYEALLDFAKNQGFSTVILDTPSQATRSHSFYKKVGFKKITKENLPIKYDYPDRDSFIFLLEI
ncbi:GNAT family N-acetyltransferase [Priestia megaterium]|jgi:N-acetylglutamate synthase-like GNAT family acetyltransferase|uniref:GNAT family N-acetyltransferase n=1 Tax=Priestia megaterium TaxID=1404 RepID=UPI000E2E5B89|nr:GNAT family N-acetyltransferase [Priestia megaterium]MCR8866645.1 GNAT family N-acetyltransferase [Priestia megaterium]MED3860748.1 GNAT family N-acetyltransferase [Priestia megaterium]MED3928690.1 GNAT family N-acetyltransferase [Priestia megaterium]RFB32581.1 GNAT family N-acetyltransferase [Bacillus sp. RC]